LDHSSEFQAITTAFRQVLKSKKITYDELAGRLGTSAQTVKRLVNGYGDISLEKLVAACRAAGIEFFDLVKLAGEPREKTFELTVEQEEFLAGHPHHHAVLTELRDKKSIADVCKKHGVSIKSGRRYLRELEGAGLLERLEGDGFKLRYEGGHNWLNRGPLHRAHHDEDIRQLFAFFMKVPAPPGTERMHTRSSTQLSRKSVELLMTDLKELAGRYRRLAQREYTTLAPADLLDVEWSFLVAAPFRVQTIPPPIEL